MVRGYKQDILKARIPKCQKTCEAFFQHLCNCCVSPAWFSFGSQQSAQTCSCAHAQNRGTASCPPDLLLIVPPSWGSRSRGISPAPKSRPGEEEQSGTVSHCHTSVCSTMLGTDMFLGSKSPSCLRPQACHPVNQAHTLSPKGEPVLAACRALPSHPLLCWYRLPC